MVELKDVNKMTDSEREVELGVDAQRRASSCLVDIKNVLMKWNCIIDPIVQIRGNEIGSSFAVVPLVKRQVS